MREYRATCLHEWNSHNVRHSKIYLHTRNVLELLTLQTLLLKIFVAEGNKACRAFIWAGILHSASKGCPLHYRIRIETPVQHHFPILEGQCWKLSDPYGVVIPAGAPGNSAFFRTPLLRTVIGARKKG